jgi:hypothetical protein
LWTTAFALIADLPVAPTMASLGAVAESLHCRPLYPDLRLAHLVRPAPATTAIPGTSL